MIVKFNVNSAIFQLYRVRLGSNFRGGSREGGGGGSWGSGHFMTHKIPPLGSAPGLYSGLTGF